MECNPIAIFSENFPYLNRWSAISERLVWILIFSWNCFFFEETFCSYHRILYIIIIIIINLIIIKTSKVSEIWMLNIEHCHTVMNIIQQKNKNVFRVRISIICWIDAKWKFIAFDYVHLLFFDRNIIRIHFRRSDLRQ